MDLAVILPSIPLGRMLQATICAVLDGLAKAVNHFFIHSDDGSGHVNCNELTERRMKPLFEFIPGRGRQSRLVSRAAEVVATEVGRQTHRTEQVDHA